MYEDVGLMFLRYENEEEDWIRERLFTPLPQHENEEEGWMFIPLPQHEYEGEDWIRERLFCFCRLSSWPPHFPKEVVSQLLLRYPFAPAQLSTGRRLVRLQFSSVK